MVINGNVFWGNLIINLLKKEIDSINIDDCEKILNNVQQQLDTRRFTLNEVSLQQFIEENNIANFIYYDEDIQSLCLHLGNPEIDSAIDVISKKRVLLKRQYTEEQLSELTVMLGGISKELRRKEIKSKILPRYHRRYQAGLPTAVISTINETFNKYIMGENCLLQKGVEKIKK